MARSIGRIATLGLLIGFAGCGGSNSPSTPSSPAPTPTPAPVTTAIYQNSGGVPPMTLVRLDFNIPNAGTVNATVDWTFASSTVAIALTTQACADPSAAFLASCSQIGTPQLDSRKPKTITGAAQAGGGRLWIANLATVDESVAVLVTLTRAGGSSLRASALQRGAMVTMPLSPALAARLRGR
jgi:hypothetical protein